MRLTFKVLIIFLLVCSLGYTKTLHVISEADSDCSDSECDLQSALDEASNDGEEDTLLIDAGEYSAQDPDAGFTYFAAEAFPISVAGVSPDSVHLHSTLTLSNLDLSVALDDTLAALSVSGLDMNGSNIKLGSKKAPLIVQSIKVQKFDSSTAPPALFSCTECVITIADSVFSDNVHSDSIVHVDLGETSQKGGELLFLNNTLTNNLIQRQNGFNLVGGLSINAKSDQTSSLIANSIIFGNVDDSGQKKDIFFDAGIDFDDDGKGSSLEILNTDFSGLSSECNSCSPKKTESKNIDAQPMFIDSVSSDFHLQSSSPCINAGIVDASFTLPDLDIDGNPRIFGSAPDMGAFELQEDPSPSSGSGGSGGCSLIQ